MIYLIPLLVFSLVLLFSLVFYQVLVKKSVVAERLEGLVPKEKLQVAPVESGTWEYKLARIGALMQLPVQQQSRYTKVLVAAGYRRESLPVFFGIKILGALLLPALCFLTLLAVPGWHSGRHLLLILLALGAGGYLLPSSWIYAKKSRRQEQIFHTLPDVLDLVTVCVEAGLSMDAALIRTVETPQFRGDPLTQELKAVTMEIRAGKPRIEALKDMAERTMVDDVKSFVTMLAQTERFGTSLSRALRSYADALRTKRRQIAEEAAAKTAIKMVFPLVFFIMPALLVVILGPALVQVAKIFR
jgi:tight adherence protein C